MKKLLFMLTAVFFTLALNAQQTEDEVYVGKGKTFGRFNVPDNRNTVPVKGQLSITGTVVKVDWCEDDCLTMWVKKDDGTIVSVGTKDYGFTIPKSIVGKRIIIEGIDPAKLITKKKTLKRDFQRDIQFAATGLRIL